ncbi:CD276 antigen-like [Hoplias malabaricus]|uniref:CD276 antigen-like n=1 Tax=Hoplias malabaricus TaxID=27720 RepID=UPI0034624FA8
MVACAQDVSTLFENQDVPVMRLLPFYIIATFLEIGEVPVAPVTVAAPGGNTTLKCNFDAGKGLNLTNLIVNWQYGETVVHSFYLGKDQLDRQGQIYRGRTHLFKEELLKGNASLRLINMQTGDEGVYACYVNNELGFTSEKIAVILAAVFNEPIFSLQPACDSINITAILSGGFPEPDLRWLDSSGREINQTSFVQWDTKGRLKVSSTVDYSTNAIETITMEMKLGVLNQSFTRSLLLHPLPDICQECCPKPPTSRNWSPTVVVLVFVVFLILCILFFLFFKYKKKRSQGRLRQDDDDRDNA